MTASALSTNCKGKPVAEVVELFSSGRLGEARGSGGGDPPQLPGNITGMQQVPQTPVRLDGASHQTWEQDFDATYNVIGVRMVGRSSLGDPGFPRLQLEGQDILQVPTTTGSGAFFWAGNVSALTAAVADPTGSRWIVDEFRAWARLPLS